VAVPFAVSDIQERVRVRCGLPAFTSNTNVTTASILSMVQESARDLSAILDTQDWYFVTTASLATTAGVPMVSLPTNFAALQRLSWLKSSNDVIALKPANLESVHPPESGDTWDVRTPGYRIVGNTVEFFPTPTAVYALELRYSTGMFVATAGDTLMGQSGWDTWIVYNCCCIVKQSQDEDYSAFASERQAKLGEILARASKRDDTGVVQPRDVAQRDNVIIRDDRWWML